MAQSGDREASERLTKENMGLVWSVAKRYFGRGVEPEDLCQLGCLGLLKAIEGFDLNFGVQFSTYAVPKIAGEIRRFLRDDGTVKVSRGLKERLQKIRVERSRLEQRLGRSPTVGEIAQALDMSVEEVAEAEAVAGPAQSLQQENGEDGFSLESVLGDYGQEDRLIERFALDEAISRLPDRERMIVSLRYFHGLTQERTAKIVGVSQVQISRLERKAVLKLRDFLSG